MVKRCGHTEAKIEFSSRGKNWNGSENVVGGGEGNTGLVQKGSMDQ